MAWKFENDKPIYLQIVERIKRDIASGVLSPGSRIQSVRELAIEAGVNPNTMQKALQTLEIEGVLQTHRTSGRYVADFVDSDIREKLGREACGRFVNSMRDIGIRDEEIVDILKRYLEGDM